MKPKATPTTAAMTVYLTSGLVVNYSLSYVAGLNIAVELGNAVAAGPGQFSVVGNDVLNPALVERFTVVYS